MPLLHNQSATRIISVLDLKQMVLVSFGDNVIPRFSPLVFFNSFM